MHVYCCLTAVINYVNWSIYWDSGSFLCLLFVCTALPLVLCLCLPLLNRAYARARDRSDSVVLPLSLSLPLSVARRFHSTSTGFGKHLLSAEMVIHFIYLMIFSSFDLTQICAKHSNGAILKWIGQLNLQMGGAFMFRVCVVIASLNSTQNIFVVICIEIILTFRKMSLTCVCACDSFFHSFLFISGEKKIYIKHTIDTLFAELFRSLSVKRRSFCTYISNWIQR